jgi:fructokinase
LVILVVGEAIVDVVERSDGSRTQHPGGSPANVAVGLARLGLEVVLATSIGTDAFGSLIESHLRDAGVELGAGSQAAATTSSAVARIGPDGAATYDFDIAWDPGTIDAPEHVEAVHTGSIAATLAPGADAVEALVERLAPTAIVSFDPNIRPALLPDREEAVARVERLVALADVVKVSDEDLAWLRPGESTDDVAMRWLEAGPALIAVTRGGAGSSAFARSGRTDVSVKPANVVDTVGAGDSYMSGLLAALAREDLLAIERREVLRAIDAEAITQVCSVAATSAARTVERAGAQLPTLAELWP